MLDHLDDLDADFLAVYRIDLRDPATDISAERFLALAFRLFAYRGSMREELLIEQDNNKTTGPPVPASPPSRGAPDRDDGATWVRPDEMQNLFPDLF